MKMYVSVLLIRWCYKFQCGEQRRKSTCPTLTPLRSQRQRMKFQLRVSLAFDLVYPFSLFIFGDLIRAWKIQWNSLPSRLIFPFAFIDSLASRYTTWAHRSSCFLNSQITIFDDASRFHSMLACRSQPSSLIWLMSSVGGNEQEKEHTTTRFLGMMNQTSDSGWHFINFHYGRQDSRRVRFWSPLVKPTVAFHFTDRFLLISCSSLSVHSQNQTAIRIR